MLGSERLRDFGGKKRLGGTIDGPHGWKERGSDGSLTDTHSRAQPKVVTITMFLIATARSHDARYPARLWLCNNSQAESKLILGLEASCFV